MAIRSVNGTILARGGQIAGSEDCCCTPPCFPDPCVVPSSTNCFHCWDAACNAGECLELVSLEVAIDGVTDVVTIPAIIPSGSCRAGFDCNCDVFNSSFVHDFSNGCQTLWTVREVSPPFPNIDTCGTPQNLTCNPWQIVRQVSVRVAVANEQVTYSTGSYNSIVFPNAYSLAGSAGNDYIVCNNYTITPGHYVIVELNMIGRVGGTGGGILYSNKKVFLYSFGNGVKFDVACANDQYYPTCSSLTGGNATLVVSSAWRRNNVTDLPTYYTTCDDVPELCQLKDATVSIEAPLVEVCTIKPPPPPPPP